MPTLKPIDTDIIVECAESSDMLFTVEDHSIIGGLGSAISNANGLMPNKPRLLSISLPDKYFNTGDYDNRTPLHIACSLGYYKIVKNIIYLFILIKDTKNIN